MSIRNWASSSLSRRRLLGAAVAASGTAVLAACGQAATPTPKPAAQAPKPADKPADKPAAAATKPADKPAAAATKPADKPAAAAATKPADKPAAPQAAKPAGKAAQGTVSFSTQGNPRELAMFEEILKGFEEKNPNIKVERKFDPSLTWEKIHVMLGAGTASSVQRANDDDIFLLTAQGVVTDLDPYVARDLNRDDYYPSTWQSRVGPGGTIGAFTNGSSPLIIWYNVDHFNEAGLTPATDWDKPWTFEQFNDALQKLTQKQGDKVNRYAFAAESWFIQPLMDNNGAERYNENETECTLMKTPAALEITQWWQDVYHKNQYGMPLSENATQLFNSGLVSMRIAQTSFGLAVKQGMNVDVMPIFLGKQKNLTENSERCFVMPQGEQNKDAAWELGKYLWQEDAQTHYAKNDYAVPMLKKVAEGPALTDPSRPPKNRKIYGEGVANDVLTHNNPVGDDFQKWFSRTVNELTTGQKDAKTFLEERVQRLNEALNRTGWDRRTGWKKGWKPGEGVELKVKPGQPAPKDAPAKPKA